MMMRVCVEANTEMDAPPASIIEGSQDGAGSGTSLGALPRQSSESVPCALEVGNLAVERLDAGFCKLTRTAAVLAGIEVQKLPDLLQCEACPLRLPDEPKAAQIGFVIMPGAASSHGGPEQVPALVEADGFDTHAAGGRKCADGH